MTRGELDRRQALDPELFFRLAPYALALGVMKPYCAAFGKQKQPPCPYIVTQIHGRSTAAEWYDLYTGMVTLMESRWRQMERERWLVIKLK